MKVFPAAIAACALLASPAPAQDLPMMTEGAYGQLLTEIEGPSDFGRALAEDGGHAFVVSFHGIAKLHFYRAPNDAGAWNCSLLVETASPLHFLDSGCMGTADFWMMPEEDARGGFSSTAALRYAREIARMERLAAAARVASAPRIELDNPGRRPADFAETAARIRAGQEEIAGLLARLGLPPQESGATKIVLSNDLDDSVPEGVRRLFHVWGLKWNDRKDPDCDGFYERIVVNGDPEGAAGDWGIPRQEQDMERILSVLRAAFGSG